MKDEYIIINKTAIQKRIEELESYNDEPETTQLKVYQEILSQSTPLIPENIDKILSTSLGSEEK